MKSIAIAPSLSLPLEVVVEKTAILAKSGAGKSNTGKVIVEGVLDAGAQVVIVDPVGHWWGLRSLFPIPVLGGMNGDIKLDPLAGKLIADVIVESGESMVLDVSLMDSDGEMQRFAYELAERLYKLKQLNPTALLIVLEEADEFAPQDTRGANVARMVGAWNRIAKRGRGRGIGLLSITLRSAALSKNVLNQSDRIIAMRTTAPLDLDAIEQWVKYHRAEGASDVIPSLPGLATGEAWVWHPEEGVLARVKIVKARSLDTSATPKVGAKPAARKKLKSIDLAALGQQITALAEKAKADDPVELRKRIRELERKQGDGPKVEQLQRESDERLARIRELEAAAAHEPVEVQVPVFDFEKFLALQETIQLDPLTTLLEQLTAVRQAIYDGLEDLRIKGTRLAEASSAERVARDKPRDVSTPAARPGSESRQQPSPRSADDAPLALVADGELPLGAARLLTVLAQFPAGRTRKQLAVLAGYKASGSTFRGAIAELRKRGYASPSGEPIVATPAGLAAAPVGELPTGRALYDYWARNLPEGARKVLEQLYAVWPNGIPRAELAELVGYEPKGSTFRGALAALRNVDLISRAGVDPIKASDELMEEAA